MIHPVSRRVPSPIAVAQAPVPTSNSAQTPSPDTVATAPPPSTVPTLDNQSFLDQLFTLESQNNAFQIGQSELQTQNADENTAAATVAQDSTSRLDLAGAIDKQQRSLLGNEIQDMGK